MMKTNGKTKTRVLPARITAWTPTAHVINLPANETEYNELVAALDYLLDTSDADETSPTAQLIDMIGDLIECYENANVPELSALRTKTKTLRKPTPARRLRVA